MNIRSLLPSADIDALLGDITEEARRRSRLWHAAQIVAVIVVGSWRDIRRHPILALRAVAIGIGSFVAFFSLLVLVSKLEVGIEIRNVWFRLPQRWSPLHLYFSVVPFQFAARVLFCTMFALSGWAVGRLHRKHGIAMVMPFAFFYAASVPANLIYSGLKGHSMPLSALSVLSDLAALMLQLGSILLGGYLATRSRLVTRDS